MSLRNPYNLDLFIQTTDREIASRVSIDIDVAKGEGSRDASGSDCCCCYSSSSSVDSLKVWSRSGTSVWIKA